jgi:hypothetical protein
MVVGGCIVALPMAWNTFGMRSVQEGAVTIAGSTGTGQRTCNQIINITTPFISTTRIVGMPAEPGRVLFA